MRVALFAPFTLMVLAVAEDEEEEDVWGRVPLGMVVVVVVEEPAGGGLDNGWRARSFSSAVLRRWVSSAARRAARPQVQSLQARRLRPGRGRHSVARGEGGGMLGIVWIWWGGGGGGWIGGKEGGEGQGMGSESPKGT